MLWAPPMKFHSLRFYWGRNLQTNKIKTICRASEVEKCVFFIVWMNQPLTPRARNHRVFTVELKLVLTKTKVHERAFKYQVPGVYEHILNPRPWTNINPDTSSGSDITALCLMYVSLSLCRVITQHVSLQRNTTRTLCVFIMCFVSHSLGTLAVLRWIKTLSWSNLQN